MHKTLFLWFPINRPVGSNYRLGGGGGGGGTDVKMVEGG